MELQATVTILENLTLTSYLTPRLTTSFTQLPSYIFMMLVSVPLFPLEKLSLAFLVSMSSGEELPALLLTLESLSLLHFSSRQPFQV